MVSNPCPGALWRAGFQTVAFGLRARSPTDSDPDSGTRVQERGHDPARAPDTHQAYRGPPRGQRQGHGVPASRTARVRPSGPFGSIGACPGPGSHPRQVKSNDRRLSRQRRGAFAEESPACRTLFRRRNERNSRAGRLWFGRSPVEVCETEGMVRTIREASRPPQPARYMVNSIVSTSLTGSAPRCQCSGVTSRATLKSTPVDGEVDLRAFREFHASG